MRFLIGFLVILTLAFSGCGTSGSGSGSGSGGGGGGGDTDQFFDTTLPSGVISLEVSPVAAGSYKYIVPLGNLNPSDHTLPTDHVYFTHDDTTSNTRDFTSAAYSYTR